jgi:2-dehydropantoate 2-reductase
MNRKNFSCLVVGAGAVGGITAALMKKAGYNVEIAVKNKEYASLISGKGIEIKGVCGDHLVRMPAYYSFSELKEKKDLILLSTKATDMIDAARLYTPILKSSGCLISMQNGMCEDELASVVGKDRIIGCVTGWGATMELHGIMTMTSKGDFIIGYPDKEPDDLLSDAAEALSSIVPVRLTGNIMGHKYSKLIINSCITSLGAICGLHLGKMLSRRKARRIFIEIIREAVAVSEKMQIKIEIFAGRLDFNEFVKNDTFLSDLRRHIMILAIGLKYRKLKSSSLQSLERGQTTEIDYLNGYIVNHGVELGVDVPVNSAVVKMIHEIQSGDRAISYRNFNDPLFDSVS